MKSSREKDDQRSVFDVRTKKTHKQKKRRSLNDRIYGRNVINLRPDFRFRHPWILAIILFVVIGVSFVGIKNLLTRGEVKDFSPTTCLGSWENPGAAEGIPETTLAASSSFSSNNSAVYDVSGTQIYCGSFIPSDFSTSGTLTSVTLNLVWQVGDTPYVPSSTIEITTSTVQDDTSSTDQVSSTDSSSTDVSSSAAFPWVTPSSTDTNTNDTSTPTSFLPFRSFFATIINKAFAQDDSDTNTNTDTGTDVTSDASDTPANPPPAVAPADTSDSSTDSSSAPAIILGPPIMASLDSDSSTISSTLPDDIANGDDMSSSSDENASSSDNASSTIPSSTVPVIAPPQAPDENFLEVSYSTDGQLWIQLAEVNVENWPNLTVQLPISNWTDLQNLQIKVQGIPSIQDPIPPVYLDGMVVEAHYDLSPDQQVTTSTYSQFLTDQSVYIIGQPINVVGGPPESFIEIYSLNNPGDSDGAANVFASQINNLGNTTIDSTSLPAGDYMLVNTFEPGACNQYTITQCEARDDYISQIPITITADSGANDSSTSE